MNKIMKRLQEHYNTISGKYEIVGLFLQGSQNYELDYEDSDIDSKAIILPTFDDFVLNKQLVSTTKVLENDEHIDLKDIRLMFDCFKKQNINFIEILFTKYKIINPKYQELFQPMIDNNELIARYNNYKAVNCIAGMSMEKYKALEHPYPSLIDKIDRYGYCSKQLHHIIRLNEFIKRYINGERYKNCLVSKNKKYLINVKRNIHTLNEAREIANILSKETKEIKDSYIKNHPVSINKNIEKLLKEVLINIMKLHFKIEINKKEI